MEDIGNCCSSDGAGLRGRGGGGGERVVMVPKKRLRGGGDGELLEQVRGGELEGRIVEGAWWLLKGATDGATEVLAIHAGKMGLVCR